VPNADGTVTYIVQANDTLMGIAARYGISLDTLYALNGLNEKSVIYIGDMILLSSAFTATPNQLTATPTEHPTITPWPTSMLTEAQTSVPPSPSDGLPVSAAGIAVGLIIGTALVMALLVALLGKK
jgi:LysM repeat protein